MRSPFVIFVVLILLTSSLALAGVGYLLVAEPWVDNTEPLPAVSVPSPTESRALPTQTTQGTTGPGSEANTLQLGMPQVWVPDDEAVAALHQCGYAEPDCASAVMRSAGATSEAIDFFLWTGWFLTGFEEKGVVDLGTASNPWRANDNNQAVLLNGWPRVLFVESAMPQGERDEATYAFIWQALPNAFPWPGDSQFAEMTLGENGPTYVFRFRVVDGAHAATTDYQLPAAFDFASDGRYLGARWLPYQP